MEVFGDEERREVMEVLETGILFRYGHDDLRIRRRVRPGGGGNRTR